MVELFANSGDPDHTPPSDLGLDYLPITLLGISRLQWDKVAPTVKFKGRYIKCLNT